MFDIRLGHVPAYKRPLILTGVEYTSALSHHENKAKMKHGVTVLLAAAVAACVTVAFAQEKYTDKYDNINLDEILSNERLYKKYFECITAETEEHCTADGKELRKSIPDALTNDCLKCTDKQKEGTKKVIKHLRDNKPEDWKKLQAKWDPEGTYMKKLGDKYQI